MMTIMITMTISIIASMANKPDFWSVSIMSGMRVVTVPP